MHLTLGERDCKMPLMNIKLTDTKAKKIGLTDLISWQEILAACGDRSFIASSEILDRFGARLPGKGRTGKGRRLAQIMQAHRLYAISHRFEDGTTKLAYAECDIRSAMLCEPERMIKPLSERMELEQLCSGSVCRVRGF